MIYAFTVYEFREIDELVFILTEYNIAEEFTDFRVMRRAPSAECWPATSRVVERQADKGWYIMFEDPDLCLMSEMTYKMFGSYDHKLEKA